jgi:hypothetical protein
MRHLVRRQINTVVLGFIALAAGCTHGTAPQSGTNDPRGNTATVDTATVDTATVDTSTGAAPGPDRGDRSASIRQLAMAIGERLDRSGSDQPVTCMATATYVALGPESLAQLGAGRTGSGTADLARLAPSEIDTMVSAMFECGLLRDAVARAAAAAGAVLSEDAVTCISDAAASDPSVRRAVAESFTGADASAVPGQVPGPLPDASDAAFERITAQCGVPESERAKLNQPTSQGEPP